MIRRAAVALALVLAFAVIYVGQQAVATLATLERVERERDTWQRPDDILRQLNVGRGSTVVDLGSGAGYFALKIARRVAPGGRVLAVDLRRESLAFLWIRARLAGDWHLEVIRGAVDDPRLPPGPVDAVLIANTFHELSAPVPVLRALRAAMRPGAPLVVVDRAPRPASDAGTHPAGEHEIDAAAAERAITAAGFETVTRDGRFIDRADGEDVWWLLVFRKA